MSVSPTSSHVYVSYSSIFSQGGNKAMTAFQAASATYANGGVQGSWQVRSASMSALDVLDISPEALEWTKPADAAAESGEANAATQATDDVTLETPPEISETERVEMIRVNKNTVLEHVKNVLAENGIAVDDAQAFDLKVNFQDGSVEVQGIEDAELSAAVNEALAGDEQLLKLMRKTRDELGLPERENTVPRNFTIEFASMMETPADAELEFKIDLFINAPPQSAGTGQATDATSAETAETEEAVPAQPTFQMSIVLSNRTPHDALQPSAVSLLDQLEAHQAEAADKKDKSNETENEVDAEEDTKEADESVTVNTAVAEADDEAEQVAEDMKYSIFGNWFNAQSSVTTTAEGMLQLDWNLQFSNWNQTGQAGSAAQTTEARRLYESINLGGSMLYSPDTLGLDPTTGTLTPSQQADRLQSLFSTSMNQYLSQGSTSSWAFDFLNQSGLDQLLG